MIDVSAVLLTYHLVASLLSAEYSQNNVTCFSATDKIKMISAYDWYVKDYRGFTQFVEAKEKCLFYTNDSYWKQTGTPFQWSIDYNRVDDWALPNGTKIITPINNQFYSVPAWKKCGKYYQYITNNSYQTVTRYCEYDAGNHGNV